MARRALRGKNSEINLDSLLDILSNVVGVMVLLAVLTVLSSQTIQLTLGTPLLRNPPANAERLYFECRDNRIFQIDEEAIDRSTEAAFARFEQKTGNRPSGVQRMVVYQEQDIGDANYRVRLSRVGRGGEVREVYWYDPREGVSGETLTEVAGGTSRFERVVSRLDPNRHYLFFIVRTDSFEIHGAARRIAEQYRLTTGWEPWDTDRRLQFSAGADLGTQIQ